ncbi:hypothetical protein SELMODRAFT_438613 [Selaginella moellendorffii]|uniref:Uncharacterized protein n=1 Tax=Selaginella moellendorffii TaxID=88036 RepID=D8QX30_SELML|nr:hypothetical protein SELMODRAFT_438613 [Selaginella moellendorffii]
MTMRILDLGPKFTLALSSSTLEQFYSHLLSPRTWLTTPEEPVWPFGIDVGGDRTPGGLGVPGKGDGVTWEVKQLAEEQLRGRWRSCCWQRWRRFIARGGEEVRPNEGRGQNELWLQARYAVTNIPEEALTQCYIASLPTSMAADIARMNPVSVHQAMSYALLADMMFSRSEWPRREGWEVRPKQTPALAPPISQLKETLHLPGKSHRWDRMKRLLEDLRLGKCLDYSEKWSRGHREVYQARRTLELGFQLQANDQGDLMPCELDEVDEAFSSWRFSRAGGGTGAVAHEAGDHLPLQHGSRSGVFPNPEKCGPTLWRFPYF